LRIRVFQPHGPASFVAWLRRIARNNLRDALRSLQREKRPNPRQRLTHAPSSEDSYVNLIELLGATTSTPSRSAMRAEAKQLLEAAMDHLPPDYAQVIRLCDLEGRTGQEVAELMGRSRGAIVMLRSRAHDRLREWLGSGSAFLTG
jgi:RNA polymerase sigma-70 factor (ECF subfamily)